jgi:hypothetical protein
VVVFLYRFWECGSSYFLEIVWERGANRVPQKFKFFFAKN